MKKYLTLLALSLLPYFAVACSCTFKSFCETMDAQSNVTTFSVIGKFGNATRKYVMVKKIEDLWGNAPKDTMVIIAAFGNTCDDDISYIKSGDSLVINLISTASNPAEFFIGSICLGNYLKINRGEINNGMQDSLSQTINYSDFKANLGNCAGLTNLDDIDIVERELSIYPNPVNDLLKIKLNLQSNFDYQMIDINGQMIREEKMIFRNHEIDLSSFQKGIYFIKIIVNESFVVRKFVKQ